MVNAFVCIFNEKKIYPLSSKGGGLARNPDFGPVEELSLKLAVF